MASKTALLRRVPLFSACSVKELSRVASVAARTSAEPGESLAEEGEPGTRFFVIEDGYAAVRRRGRKVAGLGPGEFFGEMALLDQGPRSATVAAETPMTLFAIDAADFHRLLDQVPFLTRQLLRGMSNRLRTIEGAPSRVWNRF